MSRARAELPPGWIRATLGEIGSWGSGGTPRTTERAYYGGAIPWVTIGDLRDGIVNKSESTITERGLRESSAKLVAPGSVLIAMYGASIGKLGIAGTQLTTNQAIAFCDPAPVDARYLFWYLMSRRKELVNAGKGGAQSNISQTVLKESPLLLAPLAEQRRIVAAIEEHLSRLDSAIGALHRAKSLIPSYRASILESACSGRLAPASPMREGTPEVEEQQSATELVASLEGLLADAGPAQRRAVTGSGSISNGDLPRGWTWVPLGRLGMIQGGIQKQPSRRPVRNKYPFLRVANVARGALDLREMHEVELFPGELERLALQRGDLLIVEGNGSPSEIGRMAEWSGAIANCVHQNHVIRFRSLPGVVPAYIEAFWNSPGGSRRVLESASSTSGLYTLSVSKVANIAVPLPPTSTQLRIAQDVDRRTTLLSELSRQVDGELARAGSLRASILQRAFVGALVAQDTQDEPASDLLARIRAARAVAVGSRSSRRTA